VSGGRGEVSRIRDGDRCSFPEEVLIRRRGKGAELQDLVLRNFTTEVLVSEGWGVEIFDSPKAFGNAVAEHFDELRLAVFKHWASS
jgi:hypothetical protein